MTRNLLSFESSFIRASAILLALCCVSNAQDLPNVSFHGETSRETNEGHTTLVWSAQDGDPTYELQCSTDQSFTNPTTVYRGRDEASFVSGLPNGRFFFRVRARQTVEDSWGPWSDTLVLSCRHHSMILAWSLFAAGGLLFALIIAFVARNARVQQHSERENA